ncbi:MAG: thioredoxin [Saprospiraceae bacterium]|nr:MAG: thioredoxin [Saprospiraceae bacterium]
MRFSNFLLPLLFIALSGCKAQNSGSSDHPYTNHLINESSPYLLQHAHNPVDWYPWGEEALAKAKAEDKMLIISVGYAACHWCHVMEHESFEDTLVSNLMNEHFINIKVDREERPDIDDIYMTACQMASGRGCGWPLNSFALPDGRPVWAGTYFPKKEWTEVLEYFVKLRQEDPQKLEQFADDLTKGIQSSGLVALREEDQSFSDELLGQLTTAFLKTIDKKWGGRQGSPKFPMPNNYEYLLKEYHRTGNPENLEVVNTTLTKIAEGGIYDHLGGGFARYATDEAWKIPHFEKMLYDNGQLVSLYANTFKLTKNPLYEKVVTQTLDFIKRDMTSEEGGFYSSYDADSDGEEGKFYIWQATEIDSILGDEVVSDLFKEYYEVKPRGNWEESNILYIRKDAEKLAKDYNLSLPEFKEKINNARAKLFSAREQRIKPGLDDKILTAWNALMLQGYIDAYQAFGKEEYLEAALKNARFIMKKVKQADNRLFRNYKDGKTAVNAFLDDYALTAQAFISLYEVTFDETWLNQAKAFMDYATEHFFDEASGMYYYTSNLDPPLVARKMELTDNVIPGSNSAAARALYSLGLYFYDEVYLEKAKQMLHNIEPQIIENEFPSFYSNWLQLYVDIVRPPYEVAIMGEGYETLLHDIQTYYLPHAIFLGGKTEGSLELLKGKLVAGDNRIYVCQNKVCKLPVQEVERALELMEEK